MNANELADDIETQYTENGGSLSLIASVLRQQQAEIEALHLELDRAYKRMMLQQTEIEALKGVVYWLKENRPEVWEDIKGWSKL